MKRHRDGLAKIHKVLSELMRIKGSSPCLVGDEVSLADLYLAPIFKYIATAPHLEEYTSLPGVDEWWSRASARTT
ncbi:glutathione S-transferase [Rhizobium sp. BK226]|uniref:glutathione binding-like protein n=1 Tax=Rhizobium sp. BK226 TaxID=2587075 RepID=UPI001612BD1D|nr:glutathione binding-like protein [Rhizobium sp. BK226]MBB4116473.1 glutathione S-transferase [Rhizobium sp. BK226]